MDADVCSCYVTHKRRPSERARGERGERKGDLDKSLTGISLDACDLIQLDNGIKGRGEDKREGESE